MKKEVAVVILKEKHRELKQAEIILEMHENGVRELREDIENLEAIINEEEDIGKDISEIAIDLKSAIDYLLEDILRLYLHTTKTHKPKLEALNQLMILAEAWNSFDEFKPDWGNRLQKKYYPAFEFRKGKFEFWGVSYVKLISDTHTSNFSFKTEKRAEQFGKQFIELFRIVLTN